MNVVRDIDPTNDLTFLRIRSKKNEIMVSPGTGSQYLFRKMGNATVTLKMSYVCFRKWELRVGAPEPERKRVSDRVVV